MNGAQESLTQTIREVVEQVRRDDVQGIGAELAFHFFLALFPFFIFLGSVGSIIASILGMENPAQQLANSLGSNMPQGAGDIIRGVIHDTVGTRNDSLLSFTVIFAIGAATLGTNSVIKALNRAYDVKESRPLWQRYLTALAITILGAPVMLAAFLFLVVVQVWGAALANSLGLGPVFGAAIDILRWPVVAFLIAAVVSLIYRFAPNVTLPWKWLSAGSVLFAVTWLVATYAFGVYVAHFNSYGNVYGVLGAVAILLIWFYIIAVALLLGAEVDTVVERGPKGQRAQDAREPENEVRRAA